MLNCYLCKSKVNEITRNYIFDESGKTYTIPNIKHLVCSDCGEVYFDSETVKKIEREIEKIRSEKPAN